jgi:ubiquinone/menaquinone biosynthesis C-methylase UbiE
MEARTSLDHDSPELAAAYDRLSDSQLAGGKRLVERLGVQAGERVLDVGCGTGRLARWIAEITGPRGVIGVDPLPERIQVARAAAPGLSFAVGNAEDLSAFADGSFDVVCMSAVFHWIENKPKALAEARRVLRRGGRLGLTTPAKELRGASTTAKLVTPILTRAPYNEHLSPAGMAVIRFGCTTTELVTTLVEAGFELLELHLLRRTQYFERGQDAVDFVQSSSFGNFGRLVAEDMKAPFLAELAAAYEGLREPSQGIPMHDHGTLAVAARD